MLPGRWARPKACLVHRIPANLYMCVQPAEKAAGCFLMARTAHCSPSKCAWGCQMVQTGILFTLAGGHESPRGRRRERGRSKGEGERERSHQKPYQQTYSFQVLITENFYCVSGICGSVLKLHKRSKRSQAALLDCKSPVQIYF